MSASDIVSFSSLGIDRRKINGDLKGTGNTMMLALIGNPRRNYNRDCQHPTNPAVKAQMVLEDVGPFRVTGLRPAVETLRVIFADIKEQQREVYDALGTQGMLCCRNVRGSNAAISNHSWGTAIDLTLDGKTDPRGDGKTQEGLLKIYEIFNKHGFFWGAAFRTEDAMHFEVSEQLLRKWADEGKLSPGAGNVSFDNGLIDFGDRGAAVEDVQEALNLALGLDIDTDGVFGTGTRAAVMEFQRLKGLNVDGKVGKNTKIALGI